MTEYNRIPKDYWIHIPELKDGRDNTVAMLLANKGIIPPKEWIHNEAI